ncbi:MAG TPA: hypothetical protein VG711_12980 [Phycisphaerales bacterium]|nr:hypothetical protein [Phycisphaerales bacterium]
MANELNRDRLKEVHQSDLTESRLNLDLIEWLKTQGMTYLLVVLVVICAYLGWVRWKDYRENQRRDAWRAFNDTQLPGSLQEVADKYDGVDSIGILARLAAADTLMNAVVTGKEAGPPPSQDPNNPTVMQDTRNPLTDAQRTEYLQRAETIYRAVVDRDDKSSAMTICAVSALNGLGTIAECNGKLDEAKDFYQRAAARSKESFPELAVQSTDYADSISQVAMAKPFPAPNFVQLQSDREQLTPISVEPWVNELLKTDEAKPGQ